MEVFPAVEELTPLVSSYKASARVLLLLASALFGTYAVVLRAFYALKGPKVPTPFITAARFGVMFGYVAVYQTIRAWRAWYDPDSHRNLPAVTQTPRSQAATRLLLTKASAELAAIDVAANLLSVPTPIRLPSLEAMRYPCAAPYA